MEEKIQTIQESVIDEVYECPNPINPDYHLHAEELNELFLLGLGECNDWVDPIFW